MNFKRTLIVTALLAASAGAFAQTTISQGKNPSFPIAINQPGSYMLTSNLVVPAGTGGIVISAPNVTLDLNGFMISGPVTCASAGVCSMAPTANHGIVSTMPNTAIRNGTIKGFQGSGVQIAGASMLADLMVTENAAYGIVGGSQAQGNTLVNRVRTTLNKLSGLYLFQSTVIDSAAANNGQAGFYLNFSALIDSSASSNAQYGVWAGSHVVLRGVRGDYNSSGNFGGNYSSAGGNMNDWTLF
ncbi:MAG: hypothetical protein E6H58_18015 [Betaproteobacteria bacterium]|jgi:hypothetical protein|nr:MAG: hypothetical protein E6H58_18015 [Betaproteobacteria bacterium]